MGLPPLVVLLVASFAVAAEPVPVAAAGPAVAAAAPGFGLSADLRGEYLHGQPILVTLTVTNEGRESRNFPDLAQRPWLVRFDLDSAGKSQARFNPPPDVDPDKTWRIAPGARREVLLEVPSGGAIPVGAYELTIRVKDGDRELTYGPRAIRVVPTKAVAASGPWHAATAEKAGLQTAWVHQGDKGAQLYLHVSDAADPRRTLGNYFLADLPEAVEPTLSWALPSHAWGRHIYWSEGANALAVLELSGPGRTGPVQRVASPWPALEPIGVGVTDEEGALYAPVWIPAPKGAGGEIRVMAPQEQGAAQFRKVAAFREKPSHVATAVDGAGNLRVVLHHEGFVDLYTLDTTPENLLPAKGQRLAAPEGATPVASRFGQLPTTAEERGGLALLVVDRLAAADGTAQLRGRWISTQGGTLRTLAPIAAPAGEIVDVLPIGGDGFGLLVRAADGTLSTVIGGKIAPVPAGASPELLLDGAGSPWLRTWGAKSPALQKL